MKKTSVYLSDEDRERLRRLAEREGVSQAMVLREAIAAYDAIRPDRDFAMAGAIGGYERPIREIPDTELLVGFGGDSDDRLPGGDHRLAEAEAEAGAARLREQAE